MIDEGKYNKLGTISKTVAIFGDLIIRHRVNVRNLYYDKSSKTSEVNKESMIFKYDKKLNSGSDNMSIRKSTDEIVIESKLMSGIKDGRGFSVKPSLIMTYNDIPNVFRLLSESERWFTGKEFRNSLFVYNNDDKGPYKVSERFESLSYVIDLSTKIKRDDDNMFLSIQPAVITDALNDMTYPGLMFKTNRGVIGGCTMSEFFALKICLRNLLNNLYSISIELVNQFLMLTK